MTRLDDELQAYEQSREAKSVKDDLVRLRSRMRGEQVIHRWVDLQGRIRSVVIEANRKSGRDLFRVESPSGEELSIIREDNASLEIKFTREMYRVTCEFDRRPAHNQELELIVKPIDGNDFSVWASKDTHVSNNDSEIAESLIVSLLRCAR